MYWTKLWRIFTYSHPIDLIHGINRTSVMILSFKFTETFSVSLSMVLSMVISSIESQP